LICKVIVQILWLTIGVFTWDFVLSVEEQLGSSREQGGAMMMNHGGESSVMFSSGDVLLDLSEIGWDDESWGVNLRLANAGRASESSFVGDREYVKSERVGYSKRVGGTEVR
jgi:hypothetical protein